jgi:hypothetical protein
VAVSIDNPTTNRPTMALTYTLQPEFLGHISTSELTKLEVLGNLPADLILSILQYIPITNIGALLLISRKSYQALSSILDPIFAKTFLGFNKTKRLRLFYSSPYLKEILPCDAINIIETLSSKRKMGFNGLLVVVDAECSSLSWMDPLDVQVLILVEVELDIWTKYINEFKNLVCLYLICCRATKVHDIYDLDNEDSYKCIELNLKEHNYLQIFLMEVTVTQPHCNILARLPPSLEICMISTLKGCDLSIYPQKPIDVILSFELSVILKYL